MYSIVLVSRVAYGQRAERLTYSGDDPVNIESTVGAEAAERIARLEVKLDHATAQHTDHEGRIRQLERARWLATGFAASLGGLVGTVVATLFGLT